MDSDRDDIGVWVIDGVLYEVEILPLHVCCMCGKVGAIIGLPPPLLAKQPDDTTHVCAPFLGGCNHGFHFDEESQGARQG